MATFLELFKKNYYDRPLEGLEHADMIQFIIYIVENNYVTDPNDEFGILVYGQGLFEKSYTYNDWLEFKIGLYADSYLYEQDGNTLEKSDIINNDFVEKILIKLLEREKKYNFDASYSAIETYRKMKKRPELT